MKTENESDLKKTYWNTVIHSVLMFGGQMFMQIVDLIFCSRLGPEASATAGTATSLFAWFMVVGNGLVYCLEYFIPHALGEGDEKKAHSFFYSGVLASTLVSIFSTVGLCLLAMNVDWLGVNPAITDSLATFTTIISISYLPLFLSPTLRVELQCRGRNHTTSIAFIAGNLLNIVLNWALIHGHLGLPALGLIGSAWANVISRFTIFAILWISVIQARAQLASIPIRWSEVHYRDYLARIFRMGLPSSLHMLFEMGAFILVSMFAAQMSTTQNAAHSIILNIATFIFMTPLGLGSAAALTLSRLNGEKRHALAIRYGWFTIRLGWIYAFFSCAFLFLFQKQLFGIYTSDAETIAYGSSILIIAAIFQAGDVTQVILAGCLRGFGKTKIQAIVNGIGHWLIGLPVGLFFAYHLNWQVRGLWIGLATGLFVVALGLYVFWQKTIHQHRAILDSEKMDAVL
jgi:MATE family multidrug resistance protein